MNSKSCSVCQKTDNLKVCSKCKSSYYCCREHQIEDWVRHKLECQVSFRDNPSNSTCSTSTTTSKELSSVEASNIYDQYDSRPLNLLSADITTDLMDHKLHEGITDKIHSCLDEKGFCIIDGAYGEDFAEGVYNDFLMLQKNSEFRRGELAGGATSDGKKEKTVVQDSIRSDMIAWLSDETILQNECDFIPQLLFNWDTLSIYFQKFHKDKIISGRTKLMAAVYPGNQTGYKRHVDNPSKDGRIYTFIYYLNKNWGPENGGYLRLFPEMSETIDYGDVEPHFNRLLIFWSDRRNPHEVHPALKERKALTAWFFDQVERQQARSENISSTMKEVSQQVTLMNLNQLEIELDTIKEKISCEALKAVNNLSDTELESFASVLKPVVGLKERLKVLNQMGIGSEIGSALIHVLVNNSYL